MHRPSVVLVVPASATANNGNAQTARRWAAMLADKYRVRLTDHWHTGDEALMLALHARRSAPAVAAWRAAHPHRPVMVVLTGTDLYRDIQVDASAQRSLRLADRLVVLHRQGLRSLPADCRAKARVCVQSSPGRATLPKTDRHLRALMVGHLREEKDPGTYQAAAMDLCERQDILLDHVGAALQPALAAAAERCMQRNPRYRWLGAQPHAATLKRIQRAHVLVHPSRMEGGAHVVIEAVVSGTPVLASRIDGNTGLLGDDYPGLFEPGDAAGLARMLQRCRDQPTMLDDLRTHCARHAAEFHPLHERQTLHRLVSELLAPAAGPAPTASTLLARPTRLTRP
jgi:putative glycosyltransferase (TIGR04348 family)